MDYNYKLSKYKNKFLEQFGGNIEESIKNLINNGFREEELSEESKIEIKQAYIYDKLRDVFDIEYDRAYDHAFNIERKTAKESIAIGNAVGNAAKEAQKDRIEAESNLVDYRIFKVRRDDGALFIIKLYKDYPVSEPLICYNGKNMYNKLQELRRVAIDDNLLVKLLIIDTFKNHERAEKEKEIAELESIKYRLISDIERTKNNIQKIKEYSDKISNWEGVIKESDKLLLKLKSNLEESKRKYDIKLEEKRKLVNKNPSADLSSFNLELSLLQQQQDKNIKQISDQTVIHDSYKPEISLIQRGLSDLLKSPIVDIPSGERDLVEKQAKIASLTSELSKIPASETFVRIDLDDILLDSINDECYYLMPIDKTEHIIPIEEGKIDKLNKLFLNSKSLDEIYDINDKLIKRYRILYKLNQRLFFAVKPINKTVQDKLNKSKSKIIFITKLFNKLKIVVLKMDNIETIIRTNDSIRKDDDNDKLLTQLITEVIEIFKDIYQNYYDYKSGSEEMKEHANIIKTECIKYLNMYGKKISTKYGHELSVIIIIKINIDTLFK